MDISYITYYINLDSRPDKRQYVEKIFKIAGIEGERFPAINGKNLDESYLRERGILSGATLKRGAMGCAFSHIEIWKKFLLTNSEYLLVFEDDVVLYNNFKERLQKVLMSCKDVSFDILSLCIRDDSRFCGGNVKDGEIINEFLYKPLNPGWGTFSYLITRDGAKNLLKMNENLKRPVDHFHIHIKNGLRFIAVRENLTWYRIIGKSDSEHL